MQYINRDLGYIDVFLEQDDVELTQRQMDRLAVIRKVFEQQKFMYDNRTHSVKDRIVSISQPYIRPIVRGKAKAPTEFGTKLDMSLDEFGYARLEKTSFDAYNEADVLIGTIERYYERTGHYPERVLVDQIYRNRNNISFCKAHGIRISGPALGRRKQQTLIEKKQAYADNTDRIEVERGFSLVKRCYGMGLIRTKLDTTTRSSVALSIIAMNVDYLAKTILRLIMISILSVYKGQDYLPENELIGCRIQTASC